MALTTDGIIEIALGLLNEIGLDALSTRRLARALDVQGPSLYHHFPSKAELLGQMAARIVAENLLSLDRRCAWDVWLRTLAGASRAMVLTYRDGARLLASSQPVPAMRRDLLPGVAEPLIQAGFSRHAADESVAVVASFVIGWTMNEQNPAMRALMGSVLDIEAGFAAGVETIVLGVAARTGMALSAQAARPRVAGQQARGTHSQARARRPA